MGQKQLLITELVTRRNIGWSCCLHKTLRFQRDRHNHTLFECGVAYNIKKRLTKNYRSDDAAAFVAMGTKLSTFKLVKNHNSEELEDEITAIENQYLARLTRAPKKHMLWKQTALIMRM